MSAGLEELAFEARAACLLWTAAARWAVGHEAEGAGGWSLVGIPSGVDGK
jgi:hypothetical protein